MTSRTRGAAALFGFVVVAAVLPATAGAAIQSVQVIDNQLFITCTDDATVVSVLCAEGDVSVNGVDPGTGGGCGCRAGANGGDAAALLLVAALLLRRRRRP